METSTHPPPGYPGGPPPTDPDFQPAAALFSLMDVDGPEFGELVDDIREHGLVQPIVRFEASGAAPVPRNPYRPQLPVRPH